MGKVIIFPTASVDKVAWVGKNSQLLLPGKNKSHYQNWIDFFYTWENGSGELSWIFFMHRIGLQIGFCNIMHHHKTWHMDFTSNVLSIDNSLSGPLFVGVLINFCKENAKTFIEFAQKKNYKKVQKLKELNLSLHRKLPVKSQFIY